MVPVSRRDARQVKFHEELNVKQFLSYTLAVLVAYAAYKMLLQPAVDGLMTTTKGK